MRRIKSSKTLCIGEYRRSIFLRILIWTPYEHSSVILNEASESSVCLSYAQPAKIKTQNHRGSVTGMDFSDQLQVDQFN